MGFRLPLVGNACDLDFVGHAWFRAIACVSADRWKITSYLYFAIRTRYALEVAGNNLRNTAAGRIYPTGIPLFVSTVTGSNLKYQTLYDRIAPGYDLAERLYHWFTRKPNYRIDFISELELKPNARVLETSVGTGANLRFFPATLTSMASTSPGGLLKKCQRNLLKWRRQIHISG